MKKSKLLLIPLSFCSLVPLFSEQSLQKNEQLPSQTPSNNSQLQGHSSAYDRHSTHQNHLSNRPQTAPQEKAVNQSENQMRGQSGQSAQTTSNTLNTPVRPPLKNALNIWLNGEALLWQATEENLTYVYRTDLSGSNDLHTVDFQWDWGFRVSGGYNIPRDGWDLSLVWTHIENHASDSKRAHLDASGAGIGEDPFLQAAWAINQLINPLEL